LSPVIQLNLTEKLQVFMELFHQGNPQCHTAFFSPENILFFENIGTDDSGFFSCHIRHPFGTIL